MRYLLTGERGWKRFEATIIAARTAADMADGEAALLAECTLSGRSVEFLAASGVDGVRIYRVGESA
jgi:hypothetical protein